MLLLIVYLLLALIISFLCSIMEAVLLSTSPSYLTVKSNEGNKWADKFSNLKANIDRPLSAILSLNTVAHTVGAAGVGAQAVKVFGDAAFGITSAVLTLLILIITEIIPKTIGARYWRYLARSVAYLINTTIFISYPLVIISSFFTKLFSKSKKEITTSREEIAALASIGTDEGVLSTKEDKILQNILKLKNVRVKEIMTPRVVVAVASEDLSLEEFLKNKNYLKFSRIPLYSGSNENITGFAIREMVFEYLAENKSDLKLKDIKREILFAPNSITLFAMWEKLLNKKEHIAIIVDEYGGMDGIVTMEDIIETLLGLEIVDEKDSVSDMQEYARKRWKARQTKYSLLEKLDSDNEPPSDNIMIS
jgi:CBS domain containing-hemolysin-like protein